MAAFIQVPRDLSKVKTKILFGLTKRQLICLSLAAALGIPFYFLLKRSGNNSIAMCGMILIMTPCFLFAMYEKDGQPMEKIMKNFIQSRFIRPRRRPYRTENYYEQLEKQAGVNKEVLRIVRGSKKSDSKK